MSIGTRCRRNQSFQGSTCWVANSVDPDETLHLRRLTRVYTVCSGLSDRIYALNIRYGKSHAQTGKIMIKSSVITNRLSITMAGLIINYLFSFDKPALVYMVKMLSLLGKNYSRQYFEIMSLLFSENRFMTFHAKCADLTW